MLGRTIRVSARDNGSPWLLSPLSTSTPSITDDGRYVVFQADFPVNVIVQGSQVTRLYESVLLRDTVTGRTFIASLSDDDAFGAGASYDAVISGNGRFIAFASEASNLVRGDTNFAADVFVRDLATGTTTRVSVDSNENQSLGPTLNDPLGNRTFGSLGVSISANGRYVAFGSRAYNLVPNDTNASSDIFVRDLVTGTTSRVSTASNGTQASVRGDSSNPSISDDGRYVAFQSIASNLVPGDTNLAFDIFVKDRLTGLTTRVSVDSTGNQGDRAGFGDIFSIPGSTNASISSNGRYIAFVSSFSDLVPGDTNNARDIFVHDQVTRRTTRVSVGTNGIQANGASFSPAISGDGRYVTFASTANNLVSGDTNGAADVFVHDRLTGTTTRASVNSQGVQALGGFYGTESNFPAISGDGRFVTFVSNGANLANDGFYSDTKQIFLRDTRFGGVTSSTFATNSDDILLQSASDPLGATSLNMDLAGLSTDPSSIIF